MLEQFAVFRHGIRRERIPPSWVTGELTDGDSGEVSCVWFGYEIADGKNQLP